MLVEQISKETGVIVRYLELLGRTASHRYKCYPIKKRNGDDRIIAHPSRQLKFIQRWLTANLFSHIPIHQVATAYRKGRNVRANAECHKNGNFLLKLDIESFFPSITSADVRWLLSSNKPRFPFELTENDENFVVNIVTRGGAIPVGAPSSPTISNQIMHEFDEVIFAECEAARVTFTRYADDMCFSTNEPNILPAIHQRVAQVLAAIEHPRLKVNSKKTVYTSRRRRRMVTGLILTTDRRVSLGRHKKREIRSLLHKFREGQLDLDSSNYLSGFLSYVNSVEPEFTASVVRKYGAEIVAAASKGRPEV